MEVNEAGRGPTPLVDRVKNILVRPQHEWPVIDAEPATIGGIYKSYVMILAAIPALAGLIGSLVIGYSAFGVTYRPTVAGAIATAIVQYAMALGAVYVFALVIEALAPHFGGVKDRLKAFKLAAYCATAGWVSGIFAIVPALAPLGLLGLYSLYLLYVGAPVLMKVPADRSLGYTAVTIVAGAVLFFVVAAIAAPITAAFMGAPTIDTGSGTLTVTG